ncbi:MAG: hypothetical protein WCD42_00330 [Rhizomicrobium sp.]
MVEFSGDVAGALPPGTRAAELSERLETARRIIEERFLAAGAQLSKYFKGLESLTATLDRLLETLNTDIVSATTANLETAAAKLYALPDSHRHRTDNIAILGDCCATLAEQIDDMKSDLAYMRVFTVNIKIVAGGIGDAGSEFSLFAEDIADCVVRVTEELDSIATDTAKLQANQRAALKQATALSRRITTLLPAVPDELVRSAGTMGEHYRGVAAAAGQVKELARDIRKAISRILLALQIGDSTRQRIEHIQNGIRATQTHDALRNHDQAQAASAYLYALEAAQLTAAAGHFNREVDEINRSLVELAQTARQLLQLHNLTFRDGSTGKGSFLGILESRLNDARELVGNIEKTDTATATTGREAAVAAEKLNKRILQIQLLKNDVQYMALNTTLKCCQIGEIGQPLSVVAIELRAHAEKLEEEAGQSLVVLEKLMQASGELSNTAATGQTLGQIAAQALHHAATRLSEANEKTEREISEIVTLGDDVARGLEQSAKQKSIQHDIGDTLALVAGAMSNLAGALPPCPPEIAAPLRQVLETLASDYTMAEERDVHRTVLAAWQMAQEEDIPAEADDDDAVLF